ncbi:MAG: magnesium transporter CorA family protein [Phycisphaerales bacterium]|nr:magnesium transporter CorA family protein [Phycisphaerales bacterium]
MFTAFARFPDGTAEQVASLEVLGPAWAKDGVTLWVDLEAPTPAEVEQIHVISALDGASLEACLRSDQRPRIEEFEKYLFIVMYGAFAPHEGTDFQPRRVAAFCGSRFLLTIHEEPLRSISTMRERCSRVGHQLLARGPDYLLYDIIDMMVDRYVEVTEHYERLVEHLEEESLDEEIDAGIIQMVSKMHRELLGLRRAATGKRDLITPVARGEYDHISETLGQRFSHLRDHLVQVIETIGTLRERLDGVRDNYHSALATRTSEVMRVLTVYAAILLPMSVIAGIYGMNLQTWPHADHPMGFWGVLVLMCLVGASMLGYFRWKKWL